MADMNIPADLDHDMKIRETVTIKYNEDGQVANVAPPDTSPYFNPPIRPGHVGPTTTTPSRDHTALNTPTDVSFDFVPDDASQHLSRHTIHIGNTIVIILTAEGGQDKTINSSQELKLNFEVAGYFCTDNQNNFNPPLPTGLNEVGTFGPYKPVPGNHETKYSFDQNRPCSDLGHGPTFTITSTN